MQNINGLIFGFSGRAFLVELRVGFRLFLVEVAAAFERAFFNHHDAQPGFGQNFSRDASASTAANDGDVARDVFRRKAKRATHDFPAALDALADGVFQLTHAWVVPVLPVMSGGLGEIKFSKDRDNPAKTSLRDPKNRPLP